MKLRKWVNFFAGFALIIAFIKIAPSVFRILPNSDVWLNSVQEKGIDVSALFYSEEVHVSSSEKTLSEKLNK